MLSQGDLASWGAPETLPWGTQGTKEPREPRLVRWPCHRRLTRTVSGSPGVTRPPSLSSPCPLPPDTTTAWMSSATMTCWMQPRARRWLRATRPASAWRTAPVTSATSSATRAPLTRRSGWVQGPGWGPRSVGTKRCPGERLGQCRGSWPLRSVGARVFSAVIRSLRGPFLHCSQACLPLERKEHSNEV